MSAIINKRPESARMDYRGDIEYTDEKGHHVTVSWSALHSCTVDALHAMHRYAQLEHKPHLKPDQYRIKKLGICYKDEARDEWGVKKERYESIAIPTGPNEPIVKRAKHEPHPDFPFIADVLSQSQKAREASIA